MATKNHKDFKRQVWSLDDYPPSPDPGFWRGMIITLCVVLALCSLILLFFLVFP